MPGCTDCSADATDRASSDPLFQRVLRLQSCYIDTEMATVTSNRSSLCSRNDAIGNVAVMFAAAGVFASASRWPDLLVAAIIAALNISAARRSPAPTVLPSELDFSADGREFCACGMILDCARSWRLSSR